MKRKSLSTKIMFGFIVTILLLGMVIYACLQAFNLSYVKESYKRLAESCARSAATSLFNLPVEHYLKNGKDDLYQKQLNTVISICKNFGLRYIYVYVPDFNKNELTSIFYVDGTSEENVKNRDLGTKVPWRLTQQEKDAFAGKENSHMLEMDNNMGHTLTSYAVVRDSSGKAVALVGADLDYDVVKNEIYGDIVIIILVVSACLLLLYFTLMTYLDKIFIKPVIEISNKMEKFTNDKYEKFNPIEVKTDDEFGMMANSFNKMVDDLQSYMKKFAETQMETIFSLAKLAQSRDDDTGKHLERVQRYCYEIAKRLKNMDLYSKVVDDKFIQNIVNASSLHDIGKVGIPDSILLKPGKLTEEEYTVMKQHTVLGYKTLRDVNAKFGENSFIEMGMIMALYHHERWDGAGYPYGIKGEDIPLPARIMALADVYDALSTKRSYKPAFSKEKCIEIITSGKGKQFDPVLVEVFLQCVDEFEKISIEFAD